MLKNLRGLMYRAFMGPYVASIDQNSINLGYRLFQKIVAYGKFCNAHKINIRLKVHCESYNTSVNLFFVALQGLKRSKY